MIRRKFSRISLIVTAMTLVATSLTASVCSADDAPTETESLGTPPAIATTTAAAAPVKAPSHHETKAASAAATASAAAAPASVLTAATTTIQSAPIAAPTAAATTATPLQLREPAASHPLELAPEPPANSLWKLGAILALLGAGAYALKKHNEKNKPAETVRSLQVLKKLSIGVRTELIVVDVDGQRLLLGVTPSSIQTLASLPDPEPEEMQEPEQAASASRISPTYRPAPEIGERSLQLGERLAALVEKSSRISETDFPAAIDRPDLRVTARPQRRTSKKPGPATEPPEGQARGLAKIGRI